AFEYEVVPGISSIQALAARHKITLNRIGQSIHITTGRKISQRLPDDSDDVIVMLDGECSFKNITDPKIDIYWGAYIGTEDEVLVSGNLQGRMHRSSGSEAKPRERRGGLWTPIFSGRPRRIDMTLAAPLAREQPRASRALERRNRAGVV